MEYKLLALDLDGTLLMPDLSVPSEVQDALLRLQRRGVCVTLSTGRMFSTAEKYARAFGLDAPLVCYNGAVLRAPGDRPLLCRPLTSELQDAVLRCCDRFGWYAQLYADDQIVVERETEDTRADPDLCTRPCREVGRLILAGLPPSPKIMTRCHPGETAFRAAVLAHATDGGLYIAASTPHLVEMMRAGVGKGQALDVLCTRLGINSSQAVVCGDSGNDLDMVRWAGLGCAMNNAVPALKESADYVCKNSNSYGVLEIIKRFFE